MPPLLKRALALMFLALLGAGCDRKAQPVAQPEEQKVVKSVADLEPPKDAGPPVDSVSYESGYDDGSKAGETAARALPPRSKSPTGEETAVKALEAAGTDTTRGPRWQRGYASGYLDGFERVSLGRK